MAGESPPVLVAPEPSKSTKLKTSSSRNTRAKNRAPMSHRKQVKPRQNGIFKRFTLLVVSFFKERFVWAKRKPDTTDADHDKRIAENYVFDEVLGIRVSRAEFEKRAKFNSDDYKPTKKEITCFPNLLTKIEQPNNSQGYISSLPSSSEPNTPTRSAPNLMSSKGLKTHNNMFKK